MSADTRGGPDRWTRRYPPLLGVAGVLFFVVAILPSALTLPQTNPARTLEYAPVPPSDADEVPPDGNVSALGLATTRGLLQEPAETPPPAPVAGGATGTGRNPRTKNCVGRPPKQTSDPLSPPCSAYFEGDNFGATYQGVTRGEVRILFVYDGGGLGGWGPSSRGGEPVPEDRTFDLAEPPTEDEFVTVRVLRVYQRYFNERYQTYDRFVHFFVRYGPAAGTDFTWTPEERKSYAAGDFAAVRPFAVVSYIGANMDAYLGYMNERDVLTFIGSSGPFTGLGQPASFYARAPGLVWSYLPSLEQRANVFSSFVCRKVVGRPVSFGGNGNIGAPRKLALMGVESTSRPDLRLYRQFVRARVEACGGRFEMEITHPIAYCGSPCDLQGAAEQMALAQQAGVTTIVEAAGIDTAYSKAAGAIEYRPEWVVSGDGANDGADASVHDQSVWEHARMVSLFTRYAGEREARPCFQAVSETDPSTPDIDTNNYACSFYNDVRSLFTGIQVAGPRLTPRQMDEGFHAIPRVASTDPTVPACFYDPGDYSCVKDAQAQWWDPEGRQPNGNNAQGCYRMVEGGRRYTARTWASEDVEAKRRPDDPCNAQGVVV